ncbi:response regulator [bacterium]|nr:response regulator [bacterium]
MRKKILVIDDEKDFCFFLKLNLETNLSLNVVTESDSERAYEVAVFEKPDLIFLDLLMPGLNGFDIKGKLKNNDSTKFIPVIALTAKEDESTIKNIKSNGFDAYLIKPVEIRELEKKINDILQ